MDRQADEALNRPALEALYIRLEKPLYNVLYRWIWDAEEAHELVQETFLRLWQMREKVRMESVEALAYRIGTNLAANRRRNRRLWQWATLHAVRGHSSHGYSAEKALEHQEVRRAVKKAIDSLPSRLRQVILLCEYSEMSYREVGRALKIPEGTVGSRRNAALKRLRQLLGPLLEE